MDFAPQGAPPSAGAWNDEASIQLSASLEERLLQLMGACLSAFMALAFHEARIWLYHAKALSSREIGEKTHLSPRQVVRALRFLVEQQLVVESPREGDRRERRYRIAGCVGMGDPIRGNTSPTSSIAQNPSGNGTPRSSIVPESSGNKTSMSSCERDLPGNKTPVSRFAPVVVVNSTSKDRKLKTTTTSTETESSARVRAVLSDAGIYGKSLNKLAATLTPERAERWALWIRWAKQQAADRYPSPAGLACFHLLRDPTRDPDFICPVPEDFEAPDEPDDPEVQAPDPEPDEAGYVGAELDSGGKQDAREVWQKALQDLKLCLTKATFDSWLSPSTGLRWEGDVLVVRVHTPYAIVWLESRLQATVQRALTGILGRHAEIRYETE